MTTSTRYPRLRVSMAILATALSLLLPSAVPAAATPAPGAVSEWTLIGTVGAGRGSTADTMLVLYGVYGYSGAGWAAFDPGLIPAVAGTVAPQIKVPAAGSHTYRLVFHISTNSSTNTNYQLDDRPAVTRPPGLATLEFTDTVQATGPHWTQWVLTNVNGDAWTFYRCEIYKQTS